MTPVTAVLLLGPSGPGPLESMVAAGRRAAAADALAVLQRLPDVDRLLVAGPQTEIDRLLVPADAAVLVDLDRPGEAFHFGMRLTALVEKYHLGRVLYLGAGSMPLLPEIELGALLRQIAGAAGRLAITNNVHSSDWAAFTDAGSIAGIAGWLERDNMLAWRLRESGGYTVNALPPSAATRLDVDTPFDLQVLRRHPRTPAHTRAALQAMAPGSDTGQLDRVVQILRAPGSRVTHIGRVAGAAAEQLASSTQCWTRVFSEERGMVSNRRWADRRVFSLVADQLDRVGEQAFVRQLAQVSELVLWDTRVYLAHHGRWPPAEERFASDLGLAGQIADGGLRRLTEAAIAAPIPVILGGHNVVAGGLYALSEISVGEAS
jgi:hypothetical protein